MVASSDDIAADTTTQNLPPPTPRDGSSVAEVQRLFLRHSDLLRGFVLGLMADRQLAADVFQELFLTVTAKADDFTPGTDFLAWARRIARYKVLEECRRQRRGAAVFEPEVLDLLLVEAEHIADDVDLRCQALRECLGTIAPKARQIVELRYADEPLAPREIAARLSWTANAVRVALARVRRVLADCVQRRLAATGVGASSLGVAALPKRGDPHP